MAKGKRDQCMYAAKHTYGLGFKHMAAVNFEMTKELANFTIYTTIQKVNFEKKEEIVKFTFPKMVPMLTRAIASLNTAAQGKNLRFVSKRAYEVTTGHYNYQVGGFSHKDYELLYVVCELV